MTAEESRLLKENNEMLKQICNYINSQIMYKPDDNIREFISNVFANLIIRRWAFKKINI